MWRGVWILPLFALVAGASQLQSDFGYRVWFHDDNAYLQRFDQFEAQFGCSFECNY